MTSPVRLEIIRASCNNCAKSKVRCSKDQPSCQRCLYQGVPCVYSPSQRSRKRPPPTPPATSPSVRTAISRDPNTSTPQRGNDTLHAQPMDIDMGTASSMPESNDAFPDGSIFASDAMSPMKWTELLEPFDSRPMSHDEMSCVLDPSPLPTPQPRIDNTLDTGFPWLLPPDDKQTFWPVPPPHQTPHQCSQLAMSAIQRLDVPVASCPSLGRLDYDPQSTPSANSGARSFDDILKDSHSSLEDLLTILGCPCTAKIDLIFLVTTSCTRVLSWYQASLDRSAACPSRDGDSSESSNSSDRSRSSIGGSRRSRSDSGVMSGLSRSFHEWVSIPSINVGAYTLEPGQTRRMVAQLILAEIDKVKEVLVAFNHSYCRQQGSFGEDDDKGLHMALEAYLRHQMKAVALTARENLN